MSFRKRVAKLEQKSPGGPRDLISGVFLKGLVAPGEPDEPIRFAECGDMRFSAAEGESEDAFVERVARVLDERPGLPWIAATFEQRPSWWPDA